jgi:hypothetical protein
VLWAAKDPESGNLERIQLVKGWVDAAGEQHESLYDVAWSDGRTPDPDSGRLPPLASTGDAAAATYSNDVGDTQLGAVWTDPDFDPAEHAFYYARVLEIPTPRWSTYDAVRPGGRDSGGSSGRHPGARLELARLVRAVASRAGGRPGAFRRPRATPRRTAATASGSATAARRGAAISLRRAGSRVGGACAAW